MASVVIFNAGVFTTEEKLGEIMKASSISFLKIRKSTGNSLAFVDFSSVQEKDAAMP
jgi:hypothetical protein